MATTKKTLVIVESPAKAKTIEKYLGKGYTVTASMGHLIDLPKSRMAIDTEHSFAPEYITVRGKAKILNEIQKLANKSDLILLASDNDREGEAIAYHLRNSIIKKSKKELKIKRIIFNEITPKAIRESVKNPSDVDESKVEAQKGRRVLDRLVGYNLSPLLWKKVKNGLSAGRVQSVALRLVCERELEVEAFIPQEYWSLDAEFVKGKSTFDAKMVSYKGKKVAFKNEDELNKVLTTLAEKEFKVSDVIVSTKKSNPKAPLITSTLQQVAANRINFTSRKTMRVAQQLYEGIKVGAKRIGLITYMRTDSTRISDVAIAEVREFISKEYPDALPQKALVYKQKKGSQDAHEAIRPTYVTYTPEYLTKYLTKEQLKIYSIIWERFVSSQMNASVNEITSYDISVGDALLRVSTSKLIVKGFQEVLKVLKPKNKLNKIPSIKKDDILDLHQWLPEQHFTSGPARYTDASIVKALEEFGIGRPSTYAPIISTLLDRYYIVRRNKQLQPTVLGRVIYDMLMKFFSDIIDVEFTASMEEQLDGVEAGSQDWVKMIEGFYAPFISKIEYVNEHMESIKGVMDEPTDEICPECGKNLVKKLGKYGFFLACPGFPDCRHTASVPLADCPNDGCDGKIISRKKQGGKGKEFYGCSNYPKCEFLTHFKPTDQNCPNCGWFLVQKTNKARGEFRACINPDCDVLHFGEGDKIIGVDKTEGDSGK